MDIDHVFLLRLQFAVTAMFHILWPILTIGLSLLLVTFEALWLKTSNIDYYHHARFWAKLFLLNFAIGVVSGMPLSFSFGMNWAPFATATGDFIGNILGYEAAMAFMLEAGFLGIMMFGWKRVPPPIHLFATIMVAFGASLSAFWIMIANAWMQTPAGWEQQGDRIIVTDYWASLTNPAAPWSVLHMWTAAVETSLFVVGGISAWYLLNNRHNEFFLRSFRIAIIGSVIAAPIQILLGDASGVVVAEYQPAKLAAMEAHWDTNGPNEGAAWNILAWPDEEAERNVWQIEIPNALSLITTHDSTGQVRGLKDFPVDERPPVAITFYAFRIMLVIGFALLFLTLWSVWMWQRKQLQPALISTHRWFLRCWIAAIPLGYIAADAGWVVREVGRQPWTIYGVMRTQESASALPIATAAWSLISFSIIYLLLFFSFLYFARRIIKHGPNLTAMPPSLKDETPIHTKPQGNFDDKRPVEETD